MVVFYNDKASLAHLLDMMKAARDGVEDHSPLMYHISLVDLLAACAEGKNVYTEIKCTSLLPLEDVVSVVTHEDCITEVAVSTRELTGRALAGAGRPQGPVLAWGQAAFQPREVKEWAADRRGSMGGWWGCGQKVGCGRLLKCR